MRQYFKIATLFFALLFLIAGCRKKSISSTTSITNLKGKVTLSIKVLHHQYALANQKVYIKLAATSFPGNDVTTYHYSATTNAKGEVQFSQLPMGNIWLYSIGYDPSVGRDVAGNTGIILSSSNVDASFNATAELYVSE